jgi:hypothetical protein
VSKRARLTTLKAVTDALAREVYVLERDVAPPLQRAERQWDCLTVSQ